MLRCFLCQSKIASFLVACDAPRMFWLCGCVCVCVCAHAQSHQTQAPWTVAHQAPPSIEFSGQECWSELPFPPPGALPDPGIKPISPASPRLAGRFFTTAPPGMPPVVHAAHVHLILIFTEYQLFARCWGISVKKTDKNLSHCGAYVVAHVRLRFIRLQGLRQKGPGGFPDFYQIFKEVVTSILQKLRNRGGGNTF